MNEYLKEEGKEFKLLEKAGFTEKQIDAIACFIDFKLKYQSEWRDNELNEAKKELRKDIRYHRHKDGKVFQPF